MEKFKLKVGDKVVVKRNLKVNEEYSSDGLLFAQGMENFKGKSITIKEVYLSIKEDRYSNIKIGTDIYSSWNWNQSMFTIQSMRKACKGR